MDKVEPGLPYVVKIKEGEWGYFLKQEGAFLDYNADLPVTDSPFKGTIKSINENVDYYTIDSSEGIFHKTTGFIPSHFAYLVYDSTAETLEAVYDDTVTGIGQATAVKLPADGKVYDMQRTWGETSAAGRSLCEERHEVYLPLTPPRQAQTSYPQHRLPWQVLRIACFGGIGVVLVGERSSSTVRSEAAYTRRFCPVWPERETSVH